MLAGRLTRQFALGPADGLAYAEIARRLDRPTWAWVRRLPSCCVAVVQIMASWVAGRGS